MSGHAVFRGVVHGNSAYLDFKQVAVRKNRGVQALVAVGFRRGDIVPEAAVYGFPESVYHPEKRITGVDAGTENTDCKQIVEIAGSDIASAHFLVNRIKMFCPALKFYGNTGGGRFFEDDGFYRIKKRAPLAALVSDNFFYLKVQFPVQLFEGKVFQFRFDPGNAQPVGKGSEYVKAFLGRGFALFFGEGIRRSHRMENRGKPDQDWADVACQREQRFSYFFRFLFVFYPGRNGGKARRLLCQFRRRRFARFV